MPFSFSPEIDMGEFKPSKRPVCIAPDCDKKAVHRHHVAYQQWAKDTDGDLDDPRNLVPVCLYHHGAHHKAFRRIPRSVLPDETVSYIQELGPRIAARFDRAYPN